MRKEYNIKVIIDDEDVRFYTENGEYNTYKLDSIPANLFILVRRCIETDRNQLEEISKQLSASPEIAK